MMGSMLSLVRPVLALGLLAAAACTDRGLSGQEGGEADDESEMSPEASQGEYDPGDRPGAPGSMYSVCADSSVCRPLEFCVFPAEEAGFCSDACAGIDDPSVCDVAPDGEARAFCFDIGLPDGRRVCAIDCEAGRECPRGMRCEAVESAGEAKRVCF
jgi:hypothetical protein